MFSQFFLLPSTPTASVIFLVFQSCFSGPSIKERISRGYLPDKSTDISSPSKQASSSQTDLKFQICHTQSRCLLMYAGTLLSPMHPLRLPHHPYHFQQFNRKLERHLTTTGNSTGHQKTLAMLQSRKSIYKKKTRESHPRNNRIFQIILRTSKLTITKNSTEKKKGHTQKHDASQPLQPNGPENRLEYPFSSGIPLPFLSPLPTQTPPLSFTANADTSIQAKSGADTGKGSASARVESAAANNENLGYGGGGGKENYD